LDEQPVVTGNGKKFILGARGIALIPAMAIVVSSVKKGPFNPFIV